MKNVLIILMIGLSFISCKWEYKTISVKGEEQKSSGKLKTNDFKVSDEALNLLGKDGWELVGIYEKNPSSFITLADYKKSRGIYIKK